MQHTKMNGMALWLREQFKKSFSNKGGYAEQELDLNSFKVLFLISVMFSTIASIAIVNFFYFSNIVDDAFHASFSFVLSVVLISSFTLVKVVGGEHSFRLVKEISATKINKYKNN